MLTKSNNAFNLTDRQAECVGRLMLADPPKAIVWWRIGEGKTRIALAWSEMQRLDGYVMVICSPNAIRQWKDEIDELGIDPNHYIFMSVGLLSSGKFKNIGAGIKCIIVDELWLFKNIKANRTRNCHTICHNLPSIGLGGSVITAGNIEDIYGQTFALGLQKVLADSLTDFRAQFCTSAEVFGGLQYYAKKNAIDIITKRLAPYTDIYFPPSKAESEIIHYTVDASAKQKKLLTDVNSDYFAILDSGEVEIKNAANLITKLQQISDGAVLDDDGNVTHIPSPKLERTVEICEELFASGERAIIWCAFKESVKLLLSQFGEKATALTSFTEFDANGWRSGKYRCCVCTAGSGASINDFANVQYAIAYSLPFSLRIMQQAFGRTNRKTSEHPIAYYLMMSTAGGIDKQVYNALKIGKYVEQGMISSATQVLGQYKAKFKL